MSDMASWPAFIVAFIVTVVFLSALRPIAKAIGLVDKPGGRKTHDGHVPIVGGIAMFLGVFVASLLVPEGHFVRLPLIVASAILVVVGVIDDRFHVPPAVRLSAQISVLLLMVYGSGLSLGSIGDPFGTGELVMGRFTVIFTGLVTLAMINAYNLVDGADGLAGSMALLAMLAVAQVAGYGHPVANVALLMSSAIVGFLIFNFPTPWNRRARTFMGDAGSTLLGFSIVWVTLGIASGPERLISPVHCLWFAAVPIFDLFTCFVRRMLKGKSPFAPGRDHFHHTLLRGGLGVRRTLGVLIALQAIYVLIGILGFEAGVPDVVMFSAWSVAGLTQRLVIKWIAKHHRAHLLRRRARLA